MRHQPKYKGDIYNEHLTNEFEPNKVIELGLHFLRKKTAT